jgi:hypothetical protein
MTIKRTICAFFVSEVQGCLIQLNAISSVFLHPLDMIDITSLESHGLFDRNVPRYTSYPTATHFSNSLRSDLMPEWLQKLNPDEPISLCPQIHLSQTWCVLKLSYPAMCRLIFSAELDGINPESFQK